MSFRNRIAPEDRRKSLKKLSRISYMGFLTNKSAKNLIRSPKIIVCGLSYTIRLFGSRLGKK